MRRPGCDTSECDCLCRPSEWTSLAAERNTHAETLRGLLIQRAEDNVGDARMYLSEGRSAARDGYRDSEAWCNTKAVAYFADAGLALVLAMLIGGAHD